MRRRLPGQALVRLGVGRRCRRRTGASARSAWFTAVPSGKTSNTPGSITTRLAPWAYFAAVTPRTAAEKSYSGRIVSRSLFLSRRLTLFLITSPLQWRHAPRRDQASARWAFSKRYDQEPLPVGHPEHKIPLLVEGVIRVRHEEREWISEHCCGLVERNAVLSSVGLCLLPVALECIAHSTASQQPTRRITCLPTLTDLSPPGGRPRPGNPPASACKSLHYTTALDASIVSPRL